METYKIQQISQSEETSKAGRKYIKLGVKINDEWYNGMGNANTKDWKEGDEIQARLYEEEWNGKMYKKIEIPKPPSVHERIDKLEARIDKMAELFKDVLAK